MDGESSPDNFSLPNTFEHPVNVPHLINNGTLVIGQSDAFPGARLIVIGNDEGGELEAMLISISGDQGNFTSLQGAMVRTAKFAEVPKLRGWKFSAPLSSTRVISQE